MPTKDKRTADEVAAFLGVVAGFATLISVGFGFGFLPPELLAPVCLLALLGIGAAAVSLLRS